MSIDSHRVTLYSGKRVEFAIRIYGVTVEGNTVCLDVTGHMAFLRVAIVNVHPDSLDLSSLKPHMDRALDQRIYKRNDSGPTIHRICVEYGQSIIGYQGDEEHPFLRVEVTNPSFLSPLRALFEEFAFGRSFSNTTYDSDTDFLLRFMVDRGLVGAGWVTAMNATPREV